MKCPVCNSRIDTYADNAIAHAEQTDEKYEKAIKALEDIEKFVESKITGLQDKRLFAVWNLVRQVSSWNVKQIGWRKRDLL